MTSRSRIEVKKIKIGLGSIAIVNIFRSIQKTCKCARPKAKLNIGFFFAKTCQKSISWPTSVGGGKCSVMSQSDWWKWDGFDVSIDELD